MQENPFQDRGNRAEIADITRKVWKKIILLNKYKIVYYNLVL